MKSTILLLAFSAIVFSSCTTAYKTGQTPDDVYFSPATPRQADDYVSSEQKDDHIYKGYDDYYNDRYLRMKVNNRIRWNDLSDWYSYEKYGFGYNYTYGSYYNPYNSWNYYYNPYCHNTVIINTTNVASYNKPRTFNLNTYNTNGTVNNNNSIFKYNNSNNQTSNTYTAPRNSTRSNICCGSRSGS